MADVTTKVCDLCEQAGARQVTIKEERRAEFVVDLCEGHYQQIEAFRQVGRNPGGNKTYKRYRKQTFEDR